MECRKILQILRRDLWPLVNFFVIFVLVSKLLFVALILRMNISPIISLILGLISSCTDVYVGSRLSYIGAERIFEVKRQVLHLHFVSSLQFLF